MSSSRYILALDIGTNSVGSAWMDHKTGTVLTGTSIFPAGVDEADDKRGEPKNAKRRGTRRTRITLRRRAERKRGLRLKLIERGLLPPDARGFKKLLEDTDPWELRRNGLREPLTPHEFGRVLLHLAQRRGALGLKLAITEDNDPLNANDEDGKVKAAIGMVRAEMLACGVRTFGEFIALKRAQRVHPLTTPDTRPADERVGAREYRDAVRNKGANYEYCADRAMIRDEFTKLWDAQKKLGGATARLLTDELRLELDDERGDAEWRNRGLLFGQRRQSWDLGTLGRCVLEPTERCAPHADMYASRYLVVETINNLRIIEHGKETPLTPEQRARIKQYLSGPLGMTKSTKRKGVAQPERPKTSVSVTDLREFMGWGKATKNTPYRFNIETDEDRIINTDWFSRDVIHGAIGVEQWKAMPDSLREGLNRALLKHDPAEDGDAERLKHGVMTWGGLSESQATALIAAWSRRPKPEIKRLNMSRRAVRNLLTVMDRDEPWQDQKKPGTQRWLTQVEARMMLAGDTDFRDVTTGQPLDDRARRRYATGAKGGTTRDRYYMNKHTLQRNGAPVIGPDGHPLAEPPPAPMISNPVVRKAIHEVRRHLVEYMTRFGRKPDEIYIELAREARMGAADADRLLFRNRLRNRIRKSIIEHFAHLDSQSATQQRVAVDRVLLCVQQNGVCALCGNQTVKTAITDRMAADGSECDVAHIIPRALGGHNGLGNIVLAHRKCNRDMGRRTPRQYWSSTLKGSFEEGMRWIDGIYGDTSRPKFSEIRKATGRALWSCYFNSHDDKRKIQQFAKDIKDIKEMTPRQDAATKYATRQVMAYLSEAIFDGEGLPERGDVRRIYATDGMWTSRFRREWGLFFDPHDKKAKGLSDTEEHERREKDRGDHRHHAIDAVVIGLCTRRMQIAWENRERDAEAAGVNAADENEMANYRRTHELPPPPPFKSRDDFRAAVQQAVFGNTGDVKVICHRPVKKKLIGALHEETHFGPVVDKDGNLTGNYTGKKSVESLTPNHLRMPTGWDELEAELHAAGTTRVRQAEIRRTLSQMEDPTPGKSGIVRDRSLRNRIRHCLRELNLNPDDFSANDIKKVATRLKQLSGVPIRSAVLLRTMKDPVLIDRKAPEYSTGRMVADPSPAAKRAYVGGNNHHIEIRTAKNNAGKEIWTGVIITAYEAAQRKVAKLRRFKAEGVPKPNDFRERGILSGADRARWKPIIRAIEHEHPIVDRRDNDELGGAFIMSLCEGETLWMLHKQTREPGYFVVAKLVKPHDLVLVPHWDARAAGERRDANDKKVPHSKRDEFSANPSDLVSLAPPGQPHAVKVRISPLSEITILEND